MNKSLVPCFPVVGGSMCNTGERSRTHASAHNAEAWHPAHSRTVFYSSTTLAPCPAFGRDAFTVLLFPPEVAVIS